MIRYAGAVGVALTLLSAPAQPNVAPSIISIGPNVQVSASMATTMHGEGTIVADPSDAKRLLVCSMIRDATIGEGVVGYLSEDGGRHWERTFESNAGDHGGDPACAYGPDGTAYVTYIPLASGSSIKARLPLFRSEDGGRTWRPGASLRYVDHESLVVDTTGGRFHGRVYIHGTSFPRTTTSVWRTGLALYASVDGGLTFDQRIERVSLGRQTVGGPGNGVVLSDGRWLTVFKNVKEFWKDADSDGVNAQAEFAPPPEPENAWLEAIASDDGGDSLNEAVTGEIYKMELDGTILGKFGHAGKQPGEFSTVHEIDCRNENELLVSEITAWRVQKISLRPQSKGSK